MDLRFYSYFRLKKYHESISLLKLLVSQNIYRTTHRGKWYDDLVRLLDKYVSKAESIATCKIALNDPLVLTHHRSSIMKRLKRLTKEKISLSPINESVKCTIISAKRVGSANGRVNYFVDGDVFSPEELALKYFVEMGYKGYHAESSILTTLFGLLFWDIIFDDCIPGVFSSKYQTAPLDINTIYFYQSRAIKIEKRIEEIMNGKGLEIAQDVYAREMLNGTSSCIGK